MDDGKDDPQFTDEIIRHELKFDKLPLSFWDPIYITYETTLDRRLYRRFPPHNHVLDNRLYLNILYDALQSPRAVKIICVSVKSVSFCFVLFCFFLFFVCFFCFFGEICMVLGLVVSQNVG